MGRHVTDEQRAVAQEKRQRMRELAKRISGMTPEQQAQAIGSTSITTIAGHALSVHNQLMVMYQGCKASVVGGFDQWRKADRIVRKGEHGYGIWVPIGAPKLEEGKPQTTDAGDLHFALASIFGIDQTEGVTAESRSAFKAEKAKSKPVAKSVDLFNQEQVAA
ncbi:MAG TPA: hypothetical protein DCZ63_12955 [Geobacter sp.]|nr:hypothetical protein [Geobacter sp.]